jgi:hypothetical protein
VPHNGTGTADLPPIGCQYTSPGDAFRIVSGLPPGTTIEMEGILMDFICDYQPCALCSLGLPTGTCEMLGGTLGGHGHCFDATLYLTVTGTGELAGFNRQLAVAVCGEVHTAMRNPGDPVQAFPTVFYRLRGELFGDPDFCTFRVKWGTDYGLPSPGHTTLTELPSGDYAVDSFFDITYQIEFEGCPFSPLDGYSGTTTLPIRLETGFEDGFPCQPRFDNSACEVVQCDYVVDECQPTSVNFDPATGQVTVLDCECRGPDQCVVDSSGASVYGCMAPDNGTGTPTLPPLDCEYTSPNDVFRIIDGLPPGTTIELEGILMDFICDNQPCGICSLRLPAGTCEMLGGSLNGHGHCFEATLDLTVTGTGSLNGFNRHLAVPVCGEVHTALRNPGDPVQSFVADFYRLRGELFGDPDFCEFIVTWGTDYGLPSLGHMTLTQLSNGDFAVDSFFDIIYQIEFQGCPGSQLDGYAGTTTATIRMETGAEPVPPGCSGDCPEGFLCDDSIVYKPDETIDVNCRCLPVDCEPTEDSSRCEVAACPGADWCRPTCVNYDANTGRITVLDCNCRDYSECYVELPEPGFNCIMPDNGSGTVDLPPEDCEYVSPHEVYLIIDGLPPGTTIELDGPLDGFLNVVSSPGGTLGGDRSTFDGDLDWDITGTGSLAGFNRHIVMSVTGEIHTGPRTPGDPVQTFPTDMYRLQGQVFGDPDFCTLRFTAGTDNGLPGPGETTLVKVPSGDYAVDSFFDIAYQIEFYGCPGSQLDGYNGITTATIRVETGGEPVRPSCTGDCPPCMFCDEQTTTNPNGTINICCNCVRNPDLNGDGKVDFKDMAIIAAYWLQNIP